MDDHSGPNRPPEISVSSQALDSAFSSVAAIGAGLNTPAAHTSVTGFAPGSKAPPALPPLPELLSKAEGSRRLRKFFDRYRDHALEWIAAEGTMKALTFVLRSTVGSGKTAHLSSLLPLLLEEIAAHQVIVLSAPTGEKCVELRQQLIGAKVAEAREIVVMLGRTAADPEFPLQQAGDAPRKMCGRSDAISAVAGAVDDISSRMCRRSYVNDQGEKVEQVCPLFDQCSYQRQNARAKHARILIVPHATLYAGQSELSEEAGRVAFVIVDENATSGLIKASSVPLENIWAVPADPASPWPCREPNAETPLPGSDLPNDPVAATVALKTRYLTDIKAIKAVIDGTRADTRMAEIRPSLIAQALADAHGVTFPTRRDLADFAYSELAFLSVFERDKSAVRSINPTTPDATVVETVEMQQLHDRHRLAGMWNRLKEQVGIWGSTEGDSRDYCRSVTVDWRATTRTKSGDPLSAPALEISYSADFRVAVGRVPTLILDADADMTLMRRWLDIEPENFETINFKFQNTGIFQVDDRTGSMASMAKEMTQEKIISTANWLAQQHRAEIEAEVTTEYDFASDRDRVVSPKAVALFTTKAAIDNMRQERTAHTAAEKSQALLDGMIDPKYVSVGHYGSLRGLNTWERCAGLVVAGRMEPGLDALERQARGIWHLETEPLNYIPAPAEGGRRLPEIGGWYRTKSGPVFNESVTGHTDPRIHAVLVSIREADLRQALGRGRFVHRENYCQVYVLTSIPLGLDIEVDSMHAWDELVASKFERVGMVGVVPDTTAHLAQLAGMTEGALRTHIHRLREKRGMSAPAPGRRVDRMRSAYIELLNRPGSFGINGRKELRVSYFMPVPGTESDYATHYATVFVAPGETLAEAKKRAGDVLMRLGATVMLEGISQEEQSDRYETLLEADLETSHDAWWDTLPWAPAGAGKWGRAAPPTYH